MEAAINPRTKLLISESPTNPHLSVVDLERFAAIGRRHGVDTLIDATLATPYNVRPLESGVDYVLHSRHQVSGRPQRPAGRRRSSARRRSWSRSASSAASWAPINAPHNIYLLLRGLKTFELRMQRHNENGQAVAEFLDRHPRVERVYYPGLPSPSRTTRSPGGPCAGFGGLVTFLVKDADWRADGRRRRCRRASRGSAPAWAASSR